jgi:ribonuclease D
MNNKDSHADPPVRVRSNDIGEAFLNAAIKERVCSCDIETSGLDWRSNALQLIQLCTPRHPVEIVQLQGCERPPERLLRLIEDAAVQKVFHHAMFDLRFMCFRWDCVAANIACTKIASKLLSPTRDNHSLQSLLQEHLDVHIDKELQKSDWGQKKLTPNQVAYAAHDVLHLMELLDTLERRLEVAGRLDLAKACYDHIPTRVQLDIGGFPDIFTY